MFDFAKRDEKVSRKLSVILESPIEHREKIIGKALRALWGFGVMQERERGYIQKLPGAGIAKEPVISNKHYSIR